jgi:hypothetical protein
MDAGDQLVAVERLGHIVVGAEAQRADLGIHLADAGKDQHGRADLGDPKLLQNVIAVHVRQIEVQADDVVIVELPEVQALLAQVSRINVEAFPGQHQLDAFGSRRLVFDQQHTHEFRPFSCGPSALYLAAFGPR